MKKDLSDDDDDDDEGNWQYGSRFENLWISHRDGSAIFSWSHAMYLICTELNWSYTLDNNLFRRTTQLKMYECGKFSLKMSKILLKYVGHI